MRDSDKLEERRAFVSSLIGVNGENADGPVLQLIANLPIMDAGKLYLPAGRVSVAEADRRERAGVKRVTGV